jgi:hypothetical protein
MDKFSTNVTPVGNQIPVMDSFIPWCIILVWLNGRDLLSRQ